MTERPIGAPPDVLGVVFGLGAALIWGAWPVVSKIGVERTLSIFDIAALRFLVAGICLSPVVWRNWRSVASWPSAALLAVGAGAPYTLISLSGLQFAPANHGGLIGPSSSMLFSFIGGWMILSDRPSPQRLVGVIVLTAGIAIVGWRSVRIHEAAQSTVLKGDLLFLAAGLLWAIYTVTFSIF